ncbi:precorrin-8X methylmutase [Halorutilales archaeon Cl-col2-1]
MTDKKNRQKQNEPNSNNPYADLGATTKQGEAIAESSMEFVRTVVGDETPEDRIRQKSVHSTGDIEFQHFMRFEGDPIESAVEAINSESKIVTDITMAKAGITSRGHSCEVVKALGHGKELAEETGMTRTAAGVVGTKDQIDGGIFVVGNAPTAAFKLCELVEEEGIEPACVVATPVGFVNAEESRQRVRQTDVPSITNVSTRGGSGLAAALTNELIHIASDRREE